MIHTYSIELYREETRSEYNVAESVARASGKPLGFATVLTTTAAREYLRTLPGDEEIDQWTHGNCLGARIIRWLNPEAIENDVMHVGFVTCTGHFVTEKAYWHVQASYGFADLMSRCYSRDIAPDGKLTARELLKLVDEYDDE